MTACFYDDENDPIGCRNLCYRRRKRGGTPFGIGSQELTSIATWSSAIVDGKVSICIQIQADRFKKYIYYLFLTESDLSCDILLL